MSLPPPVDEQTALAHVLALATPAAGDDAAVLARVEGETCISTDSTIAGVHAPIGTTPHDLGRRAAARALSDLAAMGVEPIAVTCAVHVPAGDWDAAVELMGGVAARCTEQRAPLVGGDLCRTRSTDLAAIVTVVGCCPAGRDGGPVARDGARAGDLVLVTGSLGACGAALRRGDVPLPAPPDRIPAAVALAPFATAMLDLSDGLARDAATLARASAVGIELDLDRVPLAAGVDDPLQATLDGDDYELLLTIRPDLLAQARATLAAIDSSIGLTVVGVASDAHAGLHATRGGSPVTLPDGFQHA